MNIVQAKGTRELGSMNGNTGSQIYSPGLHLFEVVDHCTPFWIIPVHSSIAVHGSHLVCLSMYWFYSCQQRQTVRDAVRKTDLCVAGCKMKAGFKDGFGGIYDVDYWVVTGHDVNMLTDVAAGVILLEHGLFVFFVSVFMMASPDIWQKTVIDGGLQPIHITKR